MPFLLVMLALVAASVVYVYRFRGKARYESPGEYFRKGWPIFAPFNCALYMTTRPRGSKAVLDPAEFPELDLLRQNNHPRRRHDSGAPELL
jgi:beta-hydroxylase